MTSSPSKYIFISLQLNPALLRYVSKGPDAGSFIISLNEAVFPAPSDEAAAIMLVASIYVAAKYYDKVAKQYALVRLAMF